MALHNKKGSNLLVKMLILRYILILTLQSLQLPIKFFLSKKKRSSSKQSIVEYTSTQSVLAMHTRKLAKKQVRILCSLFEYASTFSELGQTSSSNFKLRTFKHAHSELQPSLRVARSSWLMLAHLQESLPPLFFFSFFYSLAFIAFLTWIKLKMKFNIVIIHLIF